MRFTLAALIAIAGCGKKPAHGGDAPPRDDAAPLADAAADARIADAPALAACTPISGTTVKLRKIGAVDSAAVLATSPPGDGRLFVVEKSGQIRMFDSAEQLLPDPFLDLTSVIDDSASELGLLGLAFHPRYGETGYLYVFYTARNPDGAPAYLDVLARYSASATDPNHADPASAQILLAIPDRYSNHNGGMLEFGPEGDLYVGTGDGGGAGDPFSNGQNTNVLLGKILRLDVDHPGNGKPYGIPPDNPFVTGGGAPEVFIYGLRNPWRWSFDRATGDLWIGDVGQANVEEIDVLPAGQQAGNNLGWNVFEGDTCYNNNAACPTATGLIAPKVTRSHTAGWRAIIGGAVYRGPCYPDLTGYYFFTDYAAHAVVRAHLEADGTVSTVEQAGAGAALPSSIHTDARGELYETTTLGNVLHLEAGP